MSGVDLFANFLIRPLTQSSLRELTTCPGGTGRNQRIKICTRIHTISGFLLVTALIRQAEVPCYVVGKPNSVKTPREVVSGGIIAFQWVTFASRILVVYN